MPYLISVSGGTLLLGLAWLLAFYAVLVNSRRARRAPAPIVTNQRHDCNVTACIHPGTVIVRERNDLGGDTVHVCGGHWAEGLKRGWFQ